jgi:uncharacterized protein YdhG (YjbR/CyaY superfamily)
MTVDEYLAAQPPRVRRLLRKVRSAIRAAVPAAEESISYRMPTYKLRGRPVAYFAGFSGHYSVFPAIGPAVEAMKAELLPYHVSKGTLRFSLEEPVPTKLITRFAKLRAQAIAPKSRRSQ